MIDESKALRGARLLVVDDRPENLGLVRQALESAGCDEVLVATTGERALRTALSQVPELILLDVLLPGMDGFETCRKLKQEEMTRAIPVIFLTALDEVEHLATGFAAGGADYITKPFRREEVLLRVELHLERVRLQRQLEENNRQLEEKNRQLEEEIGRRRQLNRRVSNYARQENERWGLSGFVGQSPSMKAVLEEIDLLSEAHAISVLITGESGTGKELVARAIHFGGPRSEGPFVPVNCSAIPRDLADALFFGHVKGAFTGADDDREGYFALAEGGTLFLDEIGDMPVDLQPKLLRTLEDSRYRPLGARQERTADVRVVAATAADPSPERLRRDLYFRLAQYSVALPPLRHRREDIPLLAGHFLRLLAGEMNREPPALDEAVLEVLMTYDFPGNVRELKNLVERALIKSRGAEIRREHLELGQPTEAASTAPVAPGVSSELPFDLERAAAWAEEEVLRRALAQSDDNVSAAARLLGTNRPRLYRILERLKDGTTDL